MSQNWKPVLEEIKAKLGNPETIRVTVEKTLKTVAEEAKESRLANEFVFPALESQKADQALSYLTDRLATTPLAKYDISGKINLARKAILNFKSQPKEATAEENAQEVNDDAVKAAAEPTLEPESLKSEPPKPSKRKVRTASPAEEN